MDSLLFSMASRFDPTDIMRGSDPVFYDVVFKLETLPGSDDPIAYAKLAVF